MVCPWGGVGWGRMGRGLGIRIGRGTLSFYRLVVFTYFVFYKFVLLSIVYMRAEPVQTYTHTCIKVGFLRAGHINHTLNHSLLFAVCTLHRYCESSVCNWFPFCSNSHDESSIFHRKGPASISFPPISVNLSKGIDRLTIKTNTND